MENVGGSCEVKGAAAPAGSAPLWKRRSRDDLPTCSSPTSSTFHALPAAPDDPDAPSPPSSIERRATGSHWGSCGRAGAVASRR